MKFGTLKLNDNSRVKYLNFNSIRLTEYLQSTDMENRKFINRLKDKINDGLFIYSDTCTELVPKNSLGIGVRVNKGNTLNFRLYYRSGVNSDIERYSDYIRNNTLCTDIIINDDIIQHIILRKGEI